MPKGKEKIQSKNKKQARGLDTHRYSGNWGIIRYEILSNHN